MSDSRPEHVIVGRVRKAHGVRGDLVVEPMSDAPDAIFAVGRRVIAGTVSGEPARDAQELNVHAVTPFKGGYIVHFAEITDRNAADTWRDRFLLLPAGEVQPPGDHEIYIHELHGMRVVLASGETVGAIEAVYELPQGLTLDVRRARDSVLVPYERVVTRIDRDARVVEIDPPAGLLD